MSNSPDLYEFEVPGHTKRDAGRVTHKLWALPCHEALAQDAEQDVGLRVQLAELLRERALPPCYWNHPVVMRHPGRHVLPVALYLDAVPWSQSDSVLGFWLVCLVTRRRYLWAVIRKEHACRCGCKGWCSFDQLFRLGLWSIQALADGHHPTSRHDGSDWLPSDGVRRARAGQGMRLPAACLYMKGDWSEFSSTLGFPSWQDGLRPCFLCSASGADMFTAAGNSHDRLRWSDNAAGEYMRACQRCSFQVTLRTEADRRKVVDKLRYDKRSGGARGRAMIEDVPEMGLMVNDRLEPSPACPDVGKVETIDTPCTLTFWRSSEESIARHRNPLLVPELGLEPRDCLAVDVLHAIHLGVLKVWARVALWGVLDSGVYGTSGTAEENVQNALLAIRHQLLQFYRRRHQENPSEQLTRLNDLTPKMVGTSAHPTLKTKGAETWGLSLFLIWLYRQYAHRLGEHWLRIVQAGEALVRVVELMTENKGRWVLPEAALKDNARGEWLPAFGLGRAFSEVFFAPNMFQHGVSRNRLCTSLRGNMVLVKGAKHRRGTIPSIGRKCFPSNVLWRCSQPFGFQTRSGLA